MLTWQMFVTSQCRRGERGTHRFFLQIKRHSTQPFLGSLQFLSTHSSIALSLENCPLLALPQPKASNFLTSHYSYYEPIHKILAFNASLIPLPPSQMATKLGFSITIPRFYTAPFRKPFVSVSSSPLLQSSSSSASRVQQPFWSSNGAKISLQRKLLLLSSKATTDQPGQVEQDEEVDSKILQYCSIDRKEKKSLGEMEQEFLQALQAFYYEGKAIMSNEEFDNLKEELMWEGSSVVMLSSDEQKFLEASMAYVSGNPIMSDKEFDKLKLKLKTDGSEIVVEGPRCSLRSRKVYSDLYVDYLKMLLLNVPAAVVALGLFFFLDDLTGFEITYLLELPEPFSFIFTWFAAIPLILWLSFSLTKVVVKDFLILKGPCPNCGTENTSFFGTILSVPSGGSTNSVKCSNCGTEMVYDSATRLITLPEPSNA